MAKERTCIRCKTSKPIHMFKTTKSPFMPGGRSIICTDCLAAMVNTENLDSVDRLMRYLDLPFDPNAWTKAFERAGKDGALASYFEVLSDESYDDSNWAIENERWRIAREQQTIVEDIEVLNRAEMIRLQRKWSDEYSIKELMWLEDYYNQICSTQNVNTPILNEYACDLCEVELKIKNGIRANEDVKKYMDARDNIIKMAHFEASNSKNAADFDSIGEVITYYTKKGWHPDWKSQPKDDIDFLMNNIQNYLRRLVTNEGSIAEQVEDKRKRYEMTERLDEEEEYEDVISEGIEYEENFEFDDSE